MGEEFLSLQGSRYQAYLTHQTPYYFTKPYQVTTHYNPLEKTILMNGHSIGFGEEIKTFLLN